MDHLNWYGKYIATWGDEAPSQFAHAFARTLPIKPGETRLLDVGTGSGIIGLYCLVEKKARSVTFIDKEQVWLDVARSNVNIKIREGVVSPSQVRFLGAADFATLPYEEVALHDLVAINPPQLPYDLTDEETRQKIDSDPIERSFRRGGGSGLEIVGRFLDWYANLPAPKPDAVILLSSFLGRRRIGEAISAAGLRRCEEPVESDATLRKMFWNQAEVFSQSPEEMRDRSIRKVGDTWHKKLLTYRLANK